MRPDLTPDPARVRAVELATEIFTELCREIPDRSPLRVVFPLAARAMRATKSETGVSLLMKHDPATGVTFS